MLLVKKIFSFMLSILIITGMLACVPVTAQAVGTSYYVDSASGNDANSGTSETAAWRTLDKVNSITFQPGDRILFKSGSVWSGMLWPKGSGASGNPIVIDLYGGTVKPIINGGGLATNRGTVFLQNQEYWEINNLEITNDDNFAVENTGGADRNGILITLDSSIGERTYNHIYVKNCYIHDVDGSSNWNGRGTGGIIYEINGPQLSYLTKFNDICVENNTIRKVDLLGILVCPINSGASETTIQANNQYSTNIYVGYNTVQDVGQGGIQINECKDCMVEYNLVDGFIRRYSRPAVGAYPYLSINTTFQFNEVCNGPASNPDGTAFDFDAYCENTLYQYNYSHDNPCGFMLLMGRNYNDVARYNISQNDSGYLFKYCLWDQLSAAYIYNNVFYYDSSKIAMENSALFANQYYFYNNIFYNSNTAAPTNWSGTNMANGIFEKNCFYEKGGVHASNEPADAGKITADPKFVNPGSGTSGINSLDGYRLESSSPCINAGKTFPGMGTRDYFGNSLYYGSSIDIGAFEYPSGTMNTTPVNLALGKTAAASNTISSAYTADKAIDGRLSTRWATSDTTRACWLEVDFGTPTTFNEVVTKEFQYNGYRVQAYNIQYWNGSSWINAYTGTTIGAAKKDVFTAVTASKIRLNITAASFAPSIWEFEVYNDPAALSSQIKMNLSTYFNSDGFSYDSSRNNGNYDGYGYTYSADLVNSNHSYDGADYQLGSFPNGSNNVINCTGQIITLTQGQYGSIRLLGSSTGGDRSGTFRINYTDSTYTDVSVNMRDWCGSTSGQKVVQTLAHRHSQTADSSQTNYIFAYYLTPDSSKTVQSVACPNNSSMHILAITLVR